MLLVKYATVGLQVQTKKDRTEKFFGPAIFQKCWQGPGTASLVAVRRRRNTLRHAFGARRKGVRKTTVFRGGSEQDRFPLLNRRSKVRPAKHPGGMFCTTCGVAPAGGSPRRGCPRWRFTPRNEREIVLLRALRALRAPQGDFM